MNLFSSFAKKYRILLMLTSLELELNPVEVIFWNSQAKVNNKCSWMCSFILFLYLYHQWKFLFRTAKRFLYVCQGEQQAKRNNAPQLLMHENTWGKQKGEDLITNQSMSQLLEGRKSFYWTTHSFTGKM